MKRPLEPVLRTLGIDFGERRIGVAISDPDGRCALPLTVIERQTDRRAAYRLADLARLEEVEHIVLGEPLGLDGSRGENALRVRRFGRRLQRASRLPVSFINEALTTVEATERLAAAGLNTARHPERRDLVAAQILLQEALDGGLPAGETPAQDVLEPDVLEPDVRQQ